MGQQGGMVAGRKRGDVCMWTSRYGGEIDAGWAINAVAGSNVGERKEKIRKILDSMWGEK